MTMSKNIATLIGFSAILMWSALVGLIRVLSERIDPVTSVTLLYSLSTIILIIIFKIPNIFKIPKKYLFFTTLLFVSYELCFSFSVTLSINIQQAIEVSVLNHLWPSLTILFMLFFKEIKFQVLLLPGLLLACFGVLYIQTNGFSLSSAQLYSNLKLNPISYVLAFSAAFLWAAYCIVLIKFGKQKNIIAYLFLMTTITLWIKTLFFTEFHFPSIDPQSWLILILAASCLGLGYAAWNIGVIHGNINILVSSSYFIPVLSAFCSAMIFQIRLESSFWIGVLIVVCGSLICWASSRVKHRLPPKRPVLKPPAKVD